MSTPSPAPAPRLPVEPADRPLYRPPARVGCSGVLVVSAATVLAFIICLRVVAPALTERIAAVEVPGPLRVVLEGTTPTATAAGPALGDAATPLPAPELTPTLGVAVPASATPVPPTRPPAPAPATPPARPAEYVAVANTGGTGVYLRAAPRADGPRLVALLDRTVLLVVGPDTTVAGQVWRNVRQTTANPQTGWVLAQYLAPASAP